MNRPATPPIPNQANERTMLLAFLDFYRAELIDRAFGLTPEQLRAGHPPTTLTLARIIGHMALVEENWFRNRFADEGYTESYQDLDWEADADAEMSQAEAWSDAELMARFEQAIADSRRITDEAGSLDQLSTLPDREGEHWNLRWILIHMIEEYARHCGHADLIRESIDGDIAN